MFIFRHINFKNMGEEVPLLFADYKSACKDSVFSTKKLFQVQDGGPTAEFYEALKLKLNVKVNYEYKNVQVAQSKQKQETDQIATNMHHQATQIAATPFTRPIKKQQQEIEIEGELPKPSPSDPKSQYQKILDELPKDQVEKISKLPQQFVNFQKATAENPITENTYIPNENASNIAKGKELVAFQGQNSHLSVIDPARLGSVLAQKVKKVIRPDWHRPWKLMRVISGHHGWVRSIAVDPANQFFVTGSSDRTIKFWDLATGNLKITYTGHISSVRGLVVSHRHPYLFSAGEDKTVKCWDLEQNKIIRDYHGHLSGVYCITQHPTLDFIATGGRDSVIRLWDIRTRTQIHVFEGHTGTINSVISQEYEPQIVSGSQDTMIRTWDIVSGRCVSTMTNHKKSVRSLAFHPNEYTFASAAPDNIKVWKCPEGIFLRNVSGHNAIVNTIAVNKENVLVSGADNGSLFFWDWKSGYNFQKMQTVPQPGSISAENGIFCSTFDQSQMRFITGECDKSIKMYKEDETATPETHPIDNFKIEFQSGKF